MIVKLSYIAPLKLTTYNMEAHFIFIITRGKYKQKKQQKKII